MYKLYRTNSHCPNPCISPSSHFSSSFVVFPFPLLGSFPSPYPRHICCPFVHDAFSSESVLSDSEVPNADGIRNQVLEHPRSSSLPVVCAARKDCGLVQEADPSPRQNGIHTEFVEHGKLVVPTPERSEEWAERIIRKWRTRCFIASQLNSFTIVVSFLTDIGPLACVSAASLSPRLFRSSLSPFYFPLPTAIHILLVYFIKRSLTGLIRLSIPL
ncbi:hypothetical protein NMY22_g11143 [Coprinellus aureogranulatus]|nr:hypothetical protein NMY22_g11143 [Coprinellus aureogranulatus]